MCENLACWVREAPGEVWWGGRSVRSREEEPTPSSHWPGPVRRPTEQRDTRVYNTLLLWQHRQQGLLQTKLYTSDSLTVTLQFVLIGSNKKTKKNLLLCIPQSRSEVYLSSTVDKIFTLYGAPISLHCHHLTLLYQNLLDAGSLQDLDPWVQRKKEGGITVGGGATEAKQLVVLTIFLTTLPCPAAATAIAWLRSGGDTTASVGRWSAPTRSWMLTRGWSLATSLGLMMLQLIPITLGKKRKNMKLW